MTVLAMRAGREHLVMQADAAPEIFGTGHRFEMCGIHTRAIAAQVI